MVEAVGILQEIVRREAPGVACQSCGGYCDRVDCAPEEIKEFGCGRSVECCSRAFVCRLCKTRWRGTAESPEAE